MADISITGAPQSVDSIQSSYMAQVHRRRLYGGLTLLIFVVLMSLDWFLVVSMIVV